MATVAAGVRDRIRGNPKPGRARHANPRRPRTERPPAATPGETGGIFIGKPRNFLDRAYKTFRPLPPPFILFPARMSSLAPSLPIALLAAALAVIPTSYAATATSEIVGVAKLAITGGGFTLAGFPFVNEPVLKASTLSAIADGIPVEVVSGNLDFDSILESGKKYYLEITASSLFEGDRFEVDEAATLASAVANKVFVESSPLNTTLFAALEGEAFSFVVREHVTLAQLARDEQLGPALQPGTAASNSDTVTLFQNGSLRSFWFRSSDRTWRIGFSDGSSEVVPPGAGFYLRRYGSGSDGVLLGVVRENGFALPIANGTQLLALGFPMPSSPSLLGLLAPTAVVSQGDALNTFANGAFTAATYQASTNTWRRGFSDVTPTPLVQPTSGFFLSSANGDPDFSQPLPFNTP